MQLTAFLHLRALPTWLALDRTQRREIAAAALQHALPDSTVTLRFFDAEAFHGRVSDVAMLTADSPQDYYFAIERLRDTALFTTPYFKIIDIIPAFENSFEAFENAASSRFFSR